MNFSELPKVLRDGYRRIQKHRSSRHPYLVHTHTSIGRERNFRRERQHPLDALTVLLVSSYDIATFNVVLNNSQMCKTLDPKDSRGEVVPGEKITSPYICRALDLLGNHGLIKSHIHHLDLYTEAYFPYHITLTEQSFRLLQVNLDLLSKEHEERLRALAEEVLAPDKAMFVKAARQRFFDERMTQALRTRRERAIEQKHLS